MRNNITISKPYQQTLETYTKIYDLKIINPMSHSSNKHFLTSKTFSSLLLLHLQLPTSTSSANLSELTNFFLSGKHQKIMFLDEVF